MDLTAEEDIQYWDMSDVIGRIVTAPYDLMDVLATSAQQPNMLYPPTLHYEDTREVPLTATPQSTLVSRQTLSGGRVVQVSSSSGVVRTSRSSQSSSSSSSASASSSVGGNTDYAPMQTVRVTNLLRPDLPPDHHNIDDYEDFSVQGITMSDILRAVHEYENAPLPLSDTLSVSFYPPKTSSTAAFDMPYRRTNSYQQYAEPTRCAVQAYVIAAGCISSGASPLAWARLKRGEPALTLGMLKRRMSSLVRQRLPVPFVVQRSLFYLSDDIPDHKLVLEALISVDSWNPQYLIETKMTPPVLISSFNEHQRCVPTVYANSYTCRAATIVTHNTKRMDDCTMDVMNETPRSVTLDFIRQYGTQEGHVLQYLIFIFHVRHPDGSAKYRMLRVPCTELEDVPQDISIEQWALGDIEEDVEYNMMVTMLYNIYDFSEVLARGIERTGPRLTFGLDTATGSDDLHTVFGGAVQDFIIAPEALRDPRVTPLVKRPTAHAPVSNRTALYMVPAQETDYLIHSAPYGMLIRAAERPLTVSALLAGDQKIVQPQESEMPLVSNYSAAIIMQQSEFVCNARSEGASDMQMYKLCTRLIDRFSRRVIMGGHLKFALIPLMTKFDRSTMSLLIDLLHHPRMIFLKSTNTGLTTLQKIYREGLIQSGATRLSVYEGLIPNRNSKFARAIVMYLTKNADGNARKFAEGLFAMAYSEDTPLLNSPALHIMRAMVYSTHYFVIDNVLIYLAPIRPGSD